MKTTGLWNTALLGTKAYWTGIAIVFMIFTSCFSQKSMINTDLKTTKLDSEIEISYLEAGSPEDPVILLIHGLGSNAKAWKKIMPHLSKDLHVYAINLPKFLNTDDNDMIGMKSYAHMVSEFMDKHKVEKAIVAGHSMGGQVALHLSHLKPEKVDKLVLLAPAGIEKFSEADRQWFRGIITPQFYASLTDEMIRKNFDVNFYGNKLPEDAQFMLEDRMKIKEDSIAYARYCDYVVKAVFSMLDEPIDGIQSKIESPTLTIFGENDQLIPNKMLHAGMTAKDLETEALKIPNNQFQRIPEAGHFLQWDQPQLISTAILNFVKD